MKPTSSVEIEEEKLTVEEELFSQADFALTHAYLQISDEKADELRQQGLKVVDCQNPRNFPGLHYICWKDAKVESDDIDLLDENSSKYTLAQKLWIISTKNIPKKMKNMEAG